MIKKCECFRCAETHATLTERLTQAERDKTELFNECQRLKQHCVASVVAVETAQRERDAALAKAEQWERTAMNNDGTWQAESNEHADLRARIEALADDLMKRGVWAHPEALRALLNPPKPSMDWLTEEHIQSLEHAGITPDFATKLRKMLQCK